MNRTERLRRSKQTERLSFEMNQIDAFDEMLYLQSSLMKGSLRVDFGFAHVQQVAHFFGVLQYLETSERETSRGQARRDTT